MQPELTRYVGIAEQIKEKNKERKALLAEKKATPILQILKHREFSRCIAELTEELEKLRSEKTLLLQSLHYADDTSADVIRKDIATMEVGNRTPVYTGEITTETAAAGTEAEEAQTP